MVQIVGVKFSDSGKTYYFNSRNISLKPGDFVVVKTHAGEQIGKVVIANRRISNTDLTLKLKSIIRKANSKDLEYLKKNEELKNKAKKVCIEKIKKYKLNMKLIDVEVEFDKSKIIFFFTSEERVDFRQLVKDLANVFKTRIELRQIGVRDEAKMLGGLGACGKGLCCATFLDNFQPVSIKMAKEQGLSLNPTKISGTCGRLMCCLNYEQNVYSELLKHTPKMGANVMTPEGAGVVKDVNLLNQTLKVQLNEKKESIPSQFSVKDVKPVNEYQKK